MNDCFFEINTDAHRLSFNGLDLNNVRYEPEEQCFTDVKFGSNYYISGETCERINVLTDYKGSRGTSDYHVEITVNDEVIKTLMVQTTPSGEIYSEEEDRSEY